MPSSNGKSGNSQRLTGVIPKSERQQLALVLQMTNDSQSADSDGGSGSRTRNERGETPLHVASIRGDLEHVKALLLQGADPNASDFAGWKPLHEACNHGWLDVSRLLLEKGAQVNAKGLADDTPLHDACVNGHLELVKLLIENGADPTQKNRRGKTPYDVATPEARLLFNNQNESTSSGEGDSEALNKPEMRRLPPHGKEKCGSPRVTLRLHHLKEKKEKAKLVQASVDHDSYDNSVNMDAVKPGETDVVALSKEGSDDPLEGGGEGKENIGDSGGNAGEGSKEGSDSSAPVKRTHSTEDEEDTRKKRRKDDAPSRGKSGSNSGGSPKSVIGGESENEDNKSVESPGPKVPPLKIVIPGASLEEQGTRNGKNGAARHHQALPYVVTTTEGGEGTSPPPPPPTVVTAPPPAPPSAAQPADPEPSTTSVAPATAATTTTTTEEQRTHQRVLRSHRSGNGGSSSGASGNPSPVGAAEAVSPRQVSPTPGADAPAELSAGTGPAEEKPSEEAQQPGVVGGVAGGTTVVGSETTAAVAVSGGGAPIPVTTPSVPGPPVASPPATTNTVELHPRKRKLKPKEQPPPPETHPEPMAAQTTEQQVTNCYQLFLNIRKQIDRRRKGLFPVQPKPPQGFKDYLMNRCTYVLAGNSNNRVPPPHASPPTSLNPGMRDLFVSQEKERYRLRMQHVIEKEKLVLSVEQEILRVHGRAARALANQALPFSACTILRDEEVYSPFTPEQEEKDRNARSRYNGRLFLSWLQDVDDKWEKIKEAMLLRHHNEAESLHAVQRMDWEWKMKELGICESKAKPVIEDSHVPMVHVSDDFDLLPA